MAAYHRVYDQVTCMLTAKKPGSAPNPALVIEYETTLLYTCCGQELVKYYQTNSLERSFPEVPIVLGLPYKEAINPTPQGSCICTRHVYTLLYQILS